MEKTRFGCDDKSGSIAFLDDTTPLKSHSAKCASLRDLHLEIRWLATIKSSEVFPLQI